VTRSQLQRRVERWATKLSPLGLAHWEFEVEIVSEDEMDNDNSEAEVQPSTKYDSANVTFKRSFVESVDVEQLDKAIIHELLHLVFRDFEAIMDLVTQELGVTSKELVEKQIDHEIEGVVERIARTLAMNL
jgi:hypothetical protein